MNDRRKKKLKFKKGGGLLFSAIALLYVSKGGGRELITKISFWTPFYEYVIVPECCENGAATKSKSCSELFFIQLQLMMKDNTGLI